MALPKQVGFAQRKAREPVGDLHYLFLINNYAESFFENVFQLGQIVSDFLFALLARNKIVNHAALNWAGAVERVERGQIFDARGIVAAKNVAHAVRFKLEDGGGVSAREKFVRGRVVERQR